MGRNHNVLCNHSVVMWVVCHDKGLQIIIGCSVPEPVSWCGTMKRVIGNCSIDHYPTVSKISNNSSVCKTQSFTFFAWSVKPAIRMMKHKDATLRTTHFLNSSSLAGLMKATVFILWCEHRDCCPSLIDVRCYTWSIIPVLHLTVICASVACQIALLLVFSCLANSWHVACCWCSTTLDPLHGCN